MGYIESGKQEGARLVCGGKLADVPSTGGLFVAPTIFADVKPSMTIFREEIFGPVLCVASFKTLDDAISIANDSEYVGSGSRQLVGGARRGGSSLLPRLTDMDGICCWWWCVVKLTCAREPDSKTMNLP